MTRQEGYRYLLYFALFSFFTLLFLLFTFPSERVTAMVNDQLRPLTGNSVTVASANLSFPWSLRLKGITASLSGKPAELGNATVSPDLRALFTGRKGANANFAGAPGSGKFFFQATGAGGEIGANNLIVDLSGLSRLMRFPVEVDGLVRGEFDFQTEDFVRGGWNGSGTFSSETIILSGSLLETFGMAPFNLSGLVLYFTVEEDLLTLGRNEVKGDLEAKVRGTVKLDTRRPENSRLDLVLDLRPTSAAREKLTPVLTMMGARPTPDGSVQLKVKGTVGRPAVTS